MAQLQPAVLSAMAEATAHEIYYAPSYASEEYPDGGEAPTIDTMIERQERNGGCELFTPGAMGSTIRHEAVYFSRDEWAQIFELARAILAAIDRGERSI